MASMHRLSTIRLKVSIRLRKSLNGGDGKTQTLQDEVKLSCFLSYLHNTMWVTYQFMKNYYIPSMEASSTPIGTLVAHQASKSWTPDEDRMRAVIIDRLVEVHGKSDAFELLGAIDHIFNGDILVTFNN
jgi:hypothetical protein